MTTKTMSPRARRVAIGLFLSTALSTVVAMQPVSAQLHAEGPAIDAFSNSEYTYCDAKLIGDLWGMTPWQGKIEIGSKFINGISRNLPAVLAESRANGNSCAWEDTGYSYEDAVALARVWGFSDSYQAKLQTALLLTNGQGIVVDQMLGR